jgi:hypothetical protein
VLLARDDCFDTPEHFRLGFAEGDCECAGAVWGTRKEVAGEEDGYGVMGGARHCFSRVKNKERTAG